MEPDRDCCLRVCRSTEPIYESSEASAGDLSLSRRTALTGSAMPTEKHCPNPVSLVSS